jgi:signal peptidase I
MVIMKKKRILNILFYVFVIYIAGYILFSAFLPHKVIDVFGFQAFNVETPSMTGKLNVNDVTISTKIRNEDALKVGDIITFQAIPSDLTREIVITHYIAKIEVIDGQKVFTTQDRYNFIEQTDIYDQWYEIVDGEKVEKDIEFLDILGRHSLRIPKIGIVISFVQNILYDPIFIVLITVNLVIIYMIVKIIIKKDPSKETEK